MRTIIAIAHTAGGDSVEGGHFIGTFATPPTLNQIGPPNSVVYFSLFDSSKSDYLELVMNPDHQGHNILNRVCYYQQKSRFVGYKFYEKDYARRTFYL